jgi:hypothetical protein
MHNLQFSYLVTDTPYTKNIDDNLYYTIELIINEKVREFLCMSEDDCYKWIRYFKVIMNYNKFADRYRLLELLYEGKYMSVFKREDKSTNEFVTVKIMDKNKITKNQHKIYNEVMIMKNLNHANIVNFITYTEDHDFLYIVMEYLNGNNLCSYFEYQHNINNKRR